MTRREARIARRTLLGGAAATAAGAVLVPRQVAAATPTRGVTSTLTDVGASAGGHSSLRRGSLIRPSAAVPPSTAPLQLYLLVTPSRLYDSRPDAAPDGPSDIAFVRGEERTVDVSYLLGDTQKPTGVPTTSDGVLLNFTLTGTVGAGHVKAWAADGAEPPTSVVNWDHAGTTIANGLICLHSAGQIKVKVNGTVGCSTHIVIDATGFLAVP